jgi:hypothetical protein
MSGEVTRREGRARRRADRLGKVLNKSRRRDPDAIDYGKWWVVDASTNALVGGDQFGWSLDEVEEYLDERERAEGDESIEEIVADPKAKQV